MSEAIKITLYRWAGSWGPFKVNIPCGECTLTNLPMSSTVFLLSWKSKIGFLTGGSR